MPIAEMASRFALECSTKQRHCDSAQLWLRFGFFGAQHN
jgi:hypothetical protein